MKLTVVFEDAVHMAHTGGSLVYRTVVVELTPEQAEALKLNGTYEVHSRIIIEGAKHNG